jgi:hypothetical protein
MFNGVQFTEQDFYAYGLGYHHGRAEGVYQPAENWTSQMQALYRIGYDSGIADYCDEIESDQREEQDYYPEGRL